MEKFRFYVEGKHFILITDHKAIEEVKKKKEFGSSRIHRWFSKLEMLDFEVLHRKGEDMVVAYALSRSMALFNTQRKSENNFSELDFMKSHDVLNHRNTVFDEVRIKNSI